jgi:hypothetical protein
MLLLLDSDSSGLVDGSFACHDNRNGSNNCPAVGTRWTAIHHDRAEVLVLRSWVACKKVARILVLALMQLIAIGHM